MERPYGRAGAERMDRQHRACAGGRAANEAELVRGACRQDAGPGREQAR